MAAEDTNLAKPQISVVKRQREQAKRERQQIKAQKRAQRKIDKAAGKPSQEYQE
jgi:hypothetical protein